jgi:23S rRNA pseudouridine2605 synthase
MTDEPRPEDNESVSNEPEVNEHALIDALETSTEDPIGDLSDGEGAKSLDPQSSISAEKEAEISAVEERSLGKPELVEGEEPTAASNDEDDDEFKPKPRPPAKLERLQKILAASGVASRRKAEEMIEQGRVQVNGKVVTALGTKADAGRDHIRVDGKLLHGAERLRYFVLNKPRGYVTTVKDPEGRPTVMQFFDKMRERLYPVGRLDYMSEGLLLVTNDGELANKLTRASAGVEKTYLVKVAGIPTESELDILRSGVAIEKGKPGSPKVRTSPARIRQVRQGDNPWFEVVLIEGRNRELRKMFEEVGHFVEKIRRVGYGPLILDQEPGNLRELDAQELDLLRKAADGKLKTPKAKEIRRRNIIDSLPPEKPAFRPRGAKPAAGPRDYQPKRSFGADRPVRSETGPRKPAPSNFAAGQGKFEPRKFGSARPGGSPSERPAWKKDDRSGNATERPPSRFTKPPEKEGRPSAGKGFGDRPTAGRTFGARPPAGRTFGNKPSGRTYPSRTQGAGTDGPRPGSPRPGGKPFTGKPGAGRKFTPKPAWKRPDTGEQAEYTRPSGLRPESSRRSAPEPLEDAGPKRPSRLHIEPVNESERSERIRPERSRPDREMPDRTGSDRTGFDRTGSARAGSDRPSFNRRPSGPSGPARSEQGRSGPGRGSFGRSGGPRPSGGRTSPSRPNSNRSGSDRPFRGEGGLARPFTTSSGKPRPGGARPSSKPAKEGGRSQGAGGERRSGSGWKPKPNFGGKSGSGAKRSGPHSVGKKSGGKRH